VHEKSLQVIKTLAPPLSTSDEETVEQIRENPYLQYFRDLQENKIPIFEREGWLCQPSLSKIGILLIRRSLIGLSEYQADAPFEASTLVLFRKRLSLEVIADINEMVVQAILCPPAEEAETESASEPPEESLSEVAAQAASPAADAPSAASDNDEDDDSVPPNAGQLILDTTCAPADIRYPTDLDLLNQARKWSERLIDELYASIAGQMERKPRTYRQVARRRYLAIARKRKPSRRLIRKGIGQQLLYLRRNLAHIDLRGCAFLDHLSWENFNESTWLQQQTERFRNRFGHYPASIHADRIYRTRDNLRWCKQRGIRLSGTPL